VFCSSQRRDHCVTMFEIHALPDDSDAAIMAAVQAGESQRFAVIVRRYRGPMLRVARSRLGCEDRAEEVVQETLLAALRWCGSYDVRRGFRTWLWTILLNQCRREAGRRRRSARVRPWTDHVDPSATATQPGESIPADDPSPLARLLAKERAELLDAFLARLSVTQADALRLRFFAGLTFDEIASATGCSLATAKNRVRGGLVRMSEMIGGQLDTAGRSKPGRQAPADDTQP
jgi:RNA polymerase sigma-70 factor, ECF subfamily